MIAYYAECTSCGTRTRHTEPRAALATANKHLCTIVPGGLKHCESCGGGFLMLVDDGPFCIRCDVLHFPTAVA